MHRSFDIPDSKDLAPDTARQWTELHAEDSLPYWEPTTKQVHCATTDKIIGRLTTLHTDTKQECVSTYCRLHQCRPPMRGTTKASSYPKLLKWFDRGQRECAQGKEGRAAHMRIWKEMGL